MTSHYRLSFFNDSGYAGLETDDGNNLMVPVLWLPNGVREGARLSVTLSTEHHSLTITIRSEAGGAEEEGLAP